MLGTEERPVMDGDGAGAGDLVLPPLLLSGTLGPHPDHIPKRRCPPVLSLGMEWTSRLSSRVARRPGAAGPENGEVGQRQHFGSAGKLRW